MSGVGSGSGSGVEANEATGHFRFFRNEFITSGPQGVENRLVACMQAVFSTNQLQFQTNGLRIVGQGGWSVGARACLLQCLSKQLTGVACQFQFKISFSFLFLFLLFACRRFAYCLVESCSSNLTHYTRGWRHQPPFDPTLNLCEPCRPVLLTKGYCAQFPLRGRMQW